MFLFKTNVYLTFKNYRTSMKIKILLLIFLLSTTFIIAQTFEYNAHISMKYDVKKGEWENTNSEGNFKMSVEIDDYNRLISVNYLTTSEKATLDLSILEKTKNNDDSVSYVCKGVKSDLLDKVLISFNTSKTEMTIMFKCKEGTCATAQYFTNK